MNRKKITVIAIAITVLFTAVGTVFADSGTAMTAEAQAAVTPSKAIDAQIGQRSFYWRQRKRSACQVVRLAGIPSLLS